MTKQKAELSFLTICLALALLLLTKSITATTSGIIFAIALVGLGMLSKSFTRTD